MTSFAFWQRWLFAVGVLISIFGILMALLSGTPIFELFNRQIDPAFWGTNSVDPNARAFQAWVYGLWGATIAGWGIFLAFIAKYPFRNKEKWAWNCLAAGLAVWFVLDTALSVYYRVYFNAVFNTVLLILVALPLLVTRNDLS
jgi:hypothetical protein